MGYFRHKEVKFQKYKSHMRLGIFAAVSSRSLDGISRGVFIQARTRQEGIADDGDIPAGKLFTYHCKFSDIIPIQTSIDKLVNTRFSEDIHRQHRVLYDPEGVEDVDETTDLEALEGPGETENIESADPVILRRLERLKGKACLMLLSLLPVEW